MYCLPIPRLIQLCFFLLHLTWIRPVFGQQANNSTNNVTDEDDHGPALRPIRLEDIDPQLFARRDADDLSRLDPLNVESFIFGNPSEDESEFSFVNMTIYTSENERILALEHMDSKLESVTCGSNETVITFDSAESFDYAAEAWDWVNDHHNNTFFLVTDNDDCAAVEERQLYVMTSAKSNADKGSIRLTGVKKDWSGSLRDVDIETGTVQKPNPSKKREVTLLGPYKIPLRHHYEGLIFDERPIVAVRCLNCTFHGTLEVSLSAQIRNFVPQLAMVNFDPKGWTVDTLLRTDAWAGMGNFVYLKMKEIYSKGIPRLSVEKKINLGFVKGVVQLGVIVSWLLYFAVYGIEMAGYLEFGMVSTLADTAHVGIDAISLIAQPANPFAHEVTGIDVNHEGKDFKSDFQFKASVSAGLAHDLGADIKVFGKKFGIGTYVNFPKLQMDVDGRPLKDQESDSPCNKVNTSDISYDLEWGVGWLARAGLSGELKNVLAYMVNDEPWLNNHADRSLERREEDEPSKHGNGATTTEKGKKPPWYLRWTLSAVLNIGDWVWDVWGTCSSSKPDEEPSQSRLPSSSRVSSSSHAPSATRIPPGPKVCELTENAVRYRQCPKTTEDCPAGGLYEKGAKITFECQKEGEEVEGEKAWGKVKDEESSDTEKYHPAMSVAAANGFPSSRKLASAATWWGWWAWGFSFVPCISFAAVIRLTAVNRCPSTRRFAAATSYPATTRFSSAIGYASVINSFTYDVSYASVVGFVAAIGSLGLNLMRITLPWEMRNVVPTKLATDNQGTRVFKLNA